MATREEMMADLAARSRRLQESPELRAAALERQRERNLQEFEQRHPGTSEWLKASAARGFGFASDMLAKVRRGEALTTNMVAAIERCMAGDKARAEKHAAEQFVAEQRSEPVNTVNLQAVEQAFERAKSQGIKWPKLTLDGFQLKPAGATSRNAGAIYVTKGRGDDGLYLGKVLSGAFQPSRDCDDDMRGKVLAAMADPLASAVAYGKRFGRCAVCNRELSDEQSIEAGIGPVCRERLFG